jgi:hypothetical protein
MYAPSVVDQILRLGFVISAWEKVVSEAQPAFLRLVRGDPSRYANVYLSARPVILQAAERLGIERQVAARLPADAGRLPLFRKNMLGKLRQGLGLVGWLSVYPLLAACAAYGLALSIGGLRRRDTLLRIGLAVISAGVLLLLVCRLAGAPVVDAVVGGNATLAPAGLDVWRILCGPLSSIAWTTVVTGLVALSLALVAGPSRAATLARHGLAPILARRSLIVWSSVVIAIAGLLLAIRAGDTYHLVVRLAFVALLVGGVELIRQTALEDQREAAGADRPRTRTGASPRVVEALAGADV